MFTGSKKDGLTQMLKKRERTNGVYLSGELCPDLKDRRRKEILEKIMGRNNVSKIAE